MVNNSENHIFTLDNGLKCVFRQSKHVGYCGITINAGSREDGPDFGLAHFVEHTIFKGTTKRKSRHIASRMEGIGGDLNAFTGKDNTTIYTAYPAGFSSRSLDLISDLAIDSIFPPEELDKEREVIVDEINLYLDNPAESIFDEFEDRIFAGSTMGHNILGTSESVRNINHDKCLAFRNRYYRASNMSLYCVDNCTPEKAYSMINKYFGKMEAGERNVRIQPVKEVKAFDEVIEREGHQAHTVLGSRVSYRHDPERFALWLLNNHIGGPNMNSLLNRELREKRGYVYTVDSGINLMDECGMFTIYFGCDREHVGPCMRIAKRLLSSLAEHPMKPATFERIRSQFLGQLLVGTDNKESQAIALGKSLLYFDKIYDMEHTKEHIMQLTPEKLRTAAERILSAGLSRLTIDPCR